PLDGQVDHGERLGVVLDHRSGEGDVGRVVVGPGVLGSGPGPGVVRAAADQQQNTSENDGENDAEGGDRAPATSSPTCSVPGHHVIVRSMAWATPSAGSGHARSAQPAGTSCGTA